MTDYAGRYGDLLAEVARAADDGFHAVEVFPPHGAEEHLLQICRAAADRGIEVWVITSYMKDNSAYLADHPEQKLVLAKDMADQDGLSTSTWGCPFQPDYKARYAVFLRQLAQLPAIRSISLNDEAFLASGCYCVFCRAAYRKEFSAEMPLLLDPSPQDFADASFRRFVAWRMRRWNEVHWEFAREIRSVNPEISVLFQSSPIAEFWFNPWWSGVDLSRMIGGLDGVCTDPYYTFHERHFDPAEVYLSEWCRFLYGVTGDKKSAVVYPQGFSHVTFTRPLTAGDGVWAALVPPACGVNRITPYNYRLMRATPAADAYRTACGFDSWFEKTRPIADAKVVHSVQTEMFCRPLPANIPEENYDAMCVMPAAHAVRNLGLSYGFLPDCRLPDKDAWRDCPLLVLPDVLALDSMQTQGLQAYLEQGGSMLLIGDFGSCDELGNFLGDSLLQRWFGVELEPAQPGFAPVHFPEGHPGGESCRAVDWAGAAVYCDGAAAPEAMLRDVRPARLPGSAEVVTRFAGGPMDGLPAVALLKNPFHPAGKIAWFAGYAGPTVKSPKYGTVVINRMFDFIGSFARWLAGDRQKLRVEAWPPQTAMRELRPFDHRTRNSFEFFALGGNGIHLGLVTSYCAEKTCFPMTLRLRGGERLHAVTDLTAGQRLDFTRSGDCFTIQLEFGHETSARLIAWEWGDFQTNG
ncbi:MAG TPA: hypothetical protein PLS03_03445 [Terrimicrobiaceae bacterium]|nr:hypothetical protein [Terrimicrobiaceae bacterium]